MSLTADASLRWPPAVPALELASAGWHDHVSDEEAHTYAPITGH
jgi:hypothetical protein